jgi:hypothetical protein
VLTAGAAPAGAPAPASRARVDLDPDGLEPGEAMDAEGADAGGDDDAAMMAMMGMSGFGSTKVCTPVTSARVRPADGAHAEQARGGQPGGRRKHHAGADMAAVHEPVSAPARVHVREAECMLQTRWIQPTARQDQVTRGVHADKHFYVLLYCMILPWSPVVLDLQVEAQNLKTRRGGCLDYSASNPKEVWKW